MLKLKPNCECCDVDLPAASTEACICTFECTFCKDCLKAHFNYICPNCGGEQVKRPIRPAKHLEKHPASTERFVNQNHSQLARFAMHSRSPQ